VARTVARTFKDSILVAAAELVVKPRNALMASPRKALPATPRDRPYSRQSVSLQAMRCPYCTSTSSQPECVLNLPVRRLAPASRTARGASPFNGPCALRDALIYVTARAGWPPRMS
jgi:hypothetical protein